MKARSTTKIGIVLLIAFLMKDVAFGAAQFIVEPEWISRFSGSGAQNVIDVRAVGVDDEGNAYVTGTFYPDYDYATIKYSADGNELWTAGYNGPSDGRDYARARDMIVDGSGNVFVTGTSESDFATIKYNTDGGLLWEALYHPGEGGYPMDLEVDSIGNVYVTGAGYVSYRESDYVTAKFDPAGNQLWAARYIGPNSPDILQSYDRASAIAVDDFGNVYVTGESWGLSTGGDYTTIKYDVYGNRIWVARYDGTGGSFDYATDITVDGVGDVYVTGLSDLDITTVKYDTAGNQKWVNRYKGGAGGWPAVALDGTGNVYVHGMSYEPETRTDIVTIKYDGNGNQLWAARFNGPRNVNDGSISFTVDGSGNAYIAGSSQGCGTEYDYVTFKYDPDGNRIWVARYNGPDDGGDTAAGIALDGSGYVYVTGNSSNSDGTWNLTTIKYGQTPAIDLTPPITTSVSVAPNPTLGGTELTLTAIVDDCKTRGGDIISAEYQVDDGAWTSMSAQDGGFDNIVEEVVAIVPALSVGVHDVCVRGTDVSGNTSPAECTLVAVYDQAAGFVAGAGWINSPPGAYTADPGLTGRAVFGFTSRYQSGANTPSGFTEFMFRVADLRFQADTFEWLVIAGARAQFKGSGTINGTGDYGFMLTAVDGQVNGGGGVDKFRMKIWDKATGTIVYDNQMDADDTESPTMAIGAGQILIQK
jgi:hypothetical protein